MQGVADPSRLRRFLAPAHLLLFALGPASLFAQLCPNSNAPCDGLPCQGNGNSSCANRTITVPDYIDVRPGSTYTIPVTVSGSFNCISPPIGTVYTAPSFETSTEVTFRGNASVTQEGFDFCITYVSRNTTGPGGCFVFIRYPVEVTSISVGAFPFNVPVVETPLRFLSTSKGLPDQFTWDFDDGTTLVGPPGDLSYASPSHQYAQAGSYTVKLTSRNTRFGDSASKSIVVNVRNVVDFSYAPTSPRAGAPVQFTDSTLPYEGPSSYQWSFGDGQTSSAKDPAITYAAAGTYQVTETVTRDKVYTKTKVIEVLGSERPDFDWSPLSPAVGQPVSFRDLTPDLPGARTWLFGDGGQSAEANPVHAYTSPGQRIVSLRIGASDFTAKAIVVRGTGPTASFRFAPSTPKAGEAVGFVDESTGDPATWLWSFDDGTTSTERNPSHAFDEARAYAVSLTVTNADGTDTTTRTVPVEPLVDFSYAPGTPKLKETVQFSDASVGLKPPIAYSWSFGDGGTSTQRNPTHAYEARGSFEVTFTATGSSGGDTVKKTIVVDPSIVAKFSFAPTTKIQPRRVVTFTDESTGTPDSWLFTFGDGKSSTLRNPTHEYAKKGAYTVTLLVARETEASTVSRPLTVDAIAPVASFTYAPGQPRVGDTIVFTDTSEDDPTSWQWRVNGSVASTASSLSYTPAQPQTIEVELTVANEAGADGTTRTVKVLPKLEELSVSVLSKYGPCFVDGIPIAAPIDVKVLDWKGTPGTLDYTLGGGPPVSVGVTPTGASFTLQSKLLDSGGLGKAFALVATARNTTGGEGIGSLEVGSFPVPSWLGSAFGSVTYEETRVKIPFKLAFPAKPWEAKLTFPDSGFLGPLRGKSVGLGKTQVTYETNVRTDCTADDSLMGGTSFDAAFGTVGGSVRGKLDYTLSPRTGFTLTKGTVGFTLAGTVKNEVLLVFAFPALIPYCAIPILDPVCNIVKLETELSVSAAPDFTFKYAFDTLTFDDFTQLVKLGGKATVSARIGPASLKVFGGISFGFTIGPGTPAIPAYGGILRKVEGGVEVGLTASVSLFTIVDLKATGTCSFTPATPLTCTGSSPVPRAPLSPGAFAVTPIEIHRTSPGLPDLAAGDPSVLVSGVSPLASPVAARLPDGDLLIAFVNENPSLANTLQRTDIWTARTGSAVGEPRAVASDDRQDLDPALAVRPDGSAVLVHSRLRNAGLSNADVKTSADLPKLHRETEVVASLYDAARGWSPPQPLTDNAVLDRGARVVALENGRALAIWLREPANEPASSEAQIVARELIGSTWGDEQVLASGLTGVAGIQAASRGNEAIVVFSDGAEIATVAYENGQWSAARDLTKDTVADRYPRVAYGPDGAPRVLWLAGEALVWQTPGGTRETVRAAGSALGLIEARLVASPSGRFALVWAAPDATAGGTTNLLARFRDPAAMGWSEDVLLARDARALSALAGFFDAQERLRVVGLATAITYESVERTFDGEKVILEGMPVEGRSDLVHLTFAPVVDLAAEGPLLVSAPAPAPGEAVTVTARVANRGLLPVSGVEVLLSEASGRRLASAAVDLLPGESRDLTLPFTYATSARDVVCSVDPTGDAEPSNNSLRHLFGNERPVPCWQSTSAGGPAPLTVGFDGGCSLDRDGRIVAHAWSFGDGTRAEGGVASHAFTRAGTYQVSLVVTDDVGATSSLLRTIAVEASTGDPRSRPSPHHLSLPVVARAKGVAGTNFVSDVTVFNRDRARDLVVRGLYMPDGRSDTFGLDLRIPPRQTRSLADVVATGFGAPSGSGWVRLDLDHPNALVESRTYNAQPEGTAGVSVAGVLDAEALTAGGRRVFPQLWRPGYRVNIAFTELSGSGSSATAIAFDARGTEAGRKTYDVPPYAHVQDSGDALYQRAGRIEVTVDGGKVVPYVTTVDNATGDAVYETGATVRSGATRVMLPGVVRARGANDTDFRTDLRIYSPAAQKIELTLALPSGTVTKSLDLPAGETRAYDDVITSLFPEATGDQAGVLFVTAPGPVVTGARTYNLAPTGTYGVSVPAREGGELLSPGETADLIQLQSDAGYRCNFAFAAFDPSGATVLLRAFDPQGNLLAVKSYSVAGSQSRQISRVFADLGITASLPSARLEVSVIDGGRVYAYATVVDNRTGDGIFVEARR